MEKSSKVGWPLRIISAITALWLVAPTLVVIPLSLTNKQSFRFPPDGWSFKFYETLFTETEWRTALLNSVQLAVVVAVVATIIGTLAALALTRGKIPGKNLLNALVVSPMIVPGIIFAVAAFNVFLAWHLVGTFSGFLLAHTVLAIPFPIITVTARLRTFNRDVERAAAVLGANPLVTFFRVTLPLLLPSVLAGAAFAFITSFDEVVVSLFIQSPKFRTLPVKMFTSVTVETDPTIAAAASVVIVLSTSLILVSQFRPKRKSRAQVEP